MKNNLLFVFSVLGLCFLTIFLAWFNVSKNNNNIAFAQGYPSGCFTVTSNETTCPECGGSVIQAQSFNSRGRNAIEVRDTVCQNVPEGSCTFINNTVSVPNNLCPTPTPTPTPTPPPGGGGCLSGFTTSGEIFKQTDSQNLCSPCDPSPAEVFECQQNGGVYDWNYCQCGQS